ncbi:MAG: hypothetical protein ACI8ZM_002231 [Crocinitomix sp.]|jgi:hypothetical protein
MIKYILILLFMVGTTVHGQLAFKNMHYRERLERSIPYFTPDKKTHTSIFPVLEASQYTNKGKGYLNLTNYNNETGQRPYSLKVYPLITLAAGIDAQNQSGIDLQLRTGLGAAIDFTAGKFIISGKLLPYATRGGFVRDSIIKAVNYDPGASRSIFENGFLQSELLFAYRPNRFFTFIGGHGKNSFGEGYRSLILSDNAMPNPFFKIETAFANVKYVNLYQIWNDNTIDPSDRSLDKKKFAAMHYISWNITKSFNLSVFETVIWQSNDTLINRGFDPNYINPIVFYRPVEYGNGSADNVLLGASLSYKFDEHHSIYTQIIFDDFLLKELRARSRWWANKYGFQIGYKSRDFLDYDNLYFQTEFNMVRPFTFSHKHSGQSYGNLNASVTHPVGANFFEVLNIVSYQPKKIRYTNKLTYTAYGVDSSNVSYGQDIFASYSNRVGQYDHLVMQGFRKNVLNETFIAEIPILPKINLYANFTYNWRMEISEAGTQHNHSIMFGLRSRIWNSYTDF